jgi:hypothetical protein
MKEAKMKTQNSISNIVTLVFKGVALAMAVAVIVLNILKVASVDTSITLLGIGLFCLAMNAFESK